MKSDLRKLKIVKDIELTALAQRVEALDFSTDKFCHLVFRTITDLTVLFRWSFRLAALTLKVLKKHQVDCSLIEVINQARISDFCEERVLVLRTYVSYEAENSTERADD